MNTLNKAWALIASVTILGASAYSGAGLFTVMTSIMGVAFVLCVANRIPLGNLIGAALAAMFGILSFEAGYFMNAVINVLVLLPLQCLAYFSWKYDFKGRFKDKADYNRLPVAVGWFTAILAAILLVGNIFTNSQMPVHDAVSASLVIGATLLLMFDSPKQWYLWIPYNAIEVLMWFAAVSLNPEVLAILVMRCVFFINSLIGYYNWRQYDKQAV